MKLRQKLALVLATSMVTAVVPVITKGSTSTTVYESYFVSGQSYGYGDKPVILRMKNTGDDKPAGTIINIEANDSTVRFTSSLYNNATLQEDNHTNDGIERLYQINNKTYTGYVAEGEISGYSDVDSVTVFVNTNGRSLSTSKYLTTNKGELFDTTGLSNTAIIEAITEIIQTSTNTDVVIGIQLIDFSDAIIYEEYDIEITTTSSINLSRSNSDIAKIVVYIDDVPVEFEAVTYFKEFELNWENTSSLYVELFQTFYDSQTLRLPIALTALSGTPSISLSGTNGITRDTIDLSYYSTFDSTTSVTLGTKGEIAVDASGNIGSIEFYESTAGAYKNNSGPYGAGVNYLIQLKNSYLEWDLSEGDDLSEYVSLKGGLRGNDVTVTVISLDDEEMIINIHDNSPVGFYPGYIELSNLPVKLENRKTYLSTGDLEIAIREVELIHTNAPTNLTGYAIEEFEYSGGVYERFTIASIVDDQIYIYVDDTIELIAGQDAKTVTIGIKEIVSGALNPSQLFYFDFDGNKCRHAYATASDVGSIPITFDGTTVSNSKIHATTGDYFITRDSSTELIIDFEALVEYLESIGYLNPSSSNYDDDLHAVLNSVEFDLKILSRINDVNDLTTVGQTADMTIAIDSKNLDDDQELYVGTVSRGFEVEHETAHLELGVKEQIGGSLTIYETDEEIFKDGRQIVIAVENPDALKIQSATFETKGLEIRVLNDGSWNTVDKNIEDDGTVWETIDVSNGYIVLKIHNESIDEPGSITIKDIEYDVWASTPRGDYDLWIGGSAIDFYNDSIDDSTTSYSSPSDLMDRYVTVEDFVVVGKDVFIHQIESTIDFSTGIATVNGKETPMKAIPYLSNTGRAMVGVRDLAEFFNISEDSILFTSGGYVTIFNGNSIITLTNGSSILYKDGQPIYMDENP